MLGGRRCSERCSGKLKDEFWRSVVRSRSKGEILEYLGFYIAKRAAAVGTSTPGVLRLGSPVRDYFRLECNGYMP